MARGYSGNKNQGKRQNPDVFLARQKSRHHHAQFFCFHRKHCRQIAHPFAVQFKCRWRLAREFDFLRAQSLEARFG
jgi:hypothetical protein